MQLTRLAVIAALLVTFLVADAAEAGPVEELTQLAVHPGDPDVFALRYLYGGEGIFITRDGGNSFSLLCNSAIDPALTRAGPLGFGSDGTLFMGIFQGLWQDDGKTCGWNKDPQFEGQWVSDVYNDPLDPEAIYIVTSSGNEGSDNGLYRREGDGAFAQVGGLEFVLISRIRVADLGDGNRRIYQSILDGTIPGSEEIGGEPVQVPNYLVRYSEDDAATWTSFAFGEAQGTLRLQDVDPTNPDRLVATLDDGDNGTKVIVSSDRGETWSDYLDLVEFGGMTIAPDGRVWIGDAGSTSDPDGPQGIYTAENFGETPTQLTGDFPVRCLHYVDADTLFACQRFTAGQVSTADGRMTETFKFTEVGQFVACDGVDMLAACETQLVSAYCGVTHFPLAPVCEPYGVDLSVLQEGGGCAFDFDAGVGTGTLPDGGCIEPADAGAPEPTSTPDSDDSFDDLIGSGDDEPTQTAAGSGGGSDDEGSGGCATVPPGHRGASGALAGVIGALAALLRVRRRRRK
ncbi:MAG: hypothetical protein OXT09_30320 [Myxococcales bacterium]|nr:hypothetical protein [Myxococcales bacterium]